MIVRAEALAAVALAVGARQEPVALLRRLAAEDPSLAVLERVAARLAAGVALPAALAECRLIARREAVWLEGLAPEALAAQLTRLAQRATAPPGGELLARLLPLWAILAASLPSLALGAVVAVVAGGFYGGLWQALGIEAPRGGPASWWFAQATGVAAALAGGWLLWSLLRVVPGLRQFTILSWELERSALAAALLRAARGGGDALGLLRRWAFYTADSDGIECALEEAGGDVAATLVLLGVVPRGGDGRPLWDEAVAEADARRGRAARAVQPMLVALLVLIGIHGFITWGSHPLGSLGFGEFHQPTFTVIGIATHALSLLFAAAWAVVLAHVVRAFGLQRGTGPAMDWPLVADRLARAMERREDLDAILRGLLLTTGPAMRRRLDAALADPDPHPGRRLARARVVPAALATAMSGADPADLPGLFRSAAAVPDDAIGQTQRQAMAMVFLCALLAGVQIYLGSLVFPRLANMLDSLHQPTPFALVQQWANRSAVAVCVLVVVSVVVVGIGSRRGWWIAGGVWPRLARGLVLRRLLAAAADEGCLARAMRGMHPRAAAGVEAAAAAGDLPGLLAAAGWPVRDPAGLERAIASDLLARERRQTRLAVAARIVMPALLAAPIALNAAAVFLALGGIQGQMVEIAGEPRICSGGTPAMALIHWWTARCEAQGAAAVEAERARHPPAGRRR